MENIFCLLIPVILNEITAFFIAVLGLRGLLPLTRSIRYWKKQLKLEQLNGFILKAVSQ